MSSAFFSSTMFTLVSPNAEGLRWPITDDNRCSAEDIFIAYIYMYMFIDSFIRNSLNETKLSRFRKAGDYSKRSSEVVQSLIKPVNYASVSFEYFIFGYASLRLSL